MPLLFAAQGRYALSTAAAPVERGTRWAIERLWSCGRCWRSQVKHFLCDFVLQTEYQVRTKGIYGHVGRLSSTPAIT